MVLLAGARTGDVQKKQQHWLKAAFRLYTPTEELDLADLGFREVRPQSPQPEQTHMELRPFFGTYFPRKAVEDGEPADEDSAIAREYAEEDLERHIRDNRGFLLVGLPESGKTLTLFHILRRLSGYLVVSPDDSSQKIPEEEIFALLKGRKVVILLDNLSIYANLNYNLELFATRMADATGGHYGVAGTCREAGDFTLVMASIGNHVTNFFENALMPLRLSPMTHVQLRDLASTTAPDLKPEDLRLYPQPGNITIRDQTNLMRDRFQSLPNQEQDLLRAMKLLDAGGIPVTFPRLSSTLTHVFGRDIMPGTLEGVLTAL